MPQRAAAPSGARWRAASAISGAAALVAALMTGAVPNLGASGSYFTSRNAETQCLDDTLPAGVDVGYSTFSDARRLSLTSERPFRLIQINADARPSYWLTNRSYAKTEGGRFFYINATGDEAIDAALVTSLFGPADSSFGCGPGQNVLVHSDPGKLAAIATYYASHPDT